MQQCAWWQWHRQMTYSEPQLQQSMGWRSENRARAVFFTAAAATFWLSSGCSTEYKSLCLYLCVCVFGWTDLSWLHVQISKLFVSLSCIKWLSCSSHEFELTNLSSFCSAKEGGVLSWHHSVCQCVGTFVWTSKTSCLAAAVYTVPL